MDSKVQILDDFEFRVSGFQILHVGTVSVRKPDKFDFRTPGIWTLTYWKCTYPSAPGLVEIVLDAAPGWLVRSPEKLRRHLGKFLR